MGALFGNGFASATRQLTWSATGSPEAPVATVPVPSGRRPVNGSEEHASGGGAKAAKSAFLRAGTSDRLYRTGLTWPSTARLQRAQPKPGDSEEAVLRNRAFGGADPEWPEPSDHPDLKSRKGSVQSAAVAARQRGFRGEDLTDLHQDATSPAALRVAVTASRAARAIRPLSLAMVTKRKPMPIMRAAYAGVALWMPANFP